MRKVFLLNLLLAFALSACSVLQIPTSTPTPTPSGPPAGYIAPQNPFPSTFKDSAITRDPVFVNQTQTIQDQNDPSKFSLTVSGNMPSPCHQLRASVSPPAPEGKIDVTLYALVDANQICEHVLASFQVDIPLGTYPPGHYIIWFNGEKIDEFNAWTSK
jgi:hypothetical protein